jgi:hypothetical protein
VEQIFNRTLKPAVCSFLNSEGGILIYGAPREDKRNPENPENFKLKPYPVGLLGDHDSIIRKIADGITPMPVGIRLNEVEVEGGIVAIFEIQDSQSKPHQTENIYQIRIDGQKKPAPHYLIQALMRQITFPDLKAFIRPLNRQTKISPKHEILIPIEVIVANFSALQNEKKLKIRIGIEGPASIIESPIRAIGIIKNSDYRTHDIVSFGEPVKFSFKIFGRFEQILEHGGFEINILFHGELSPSKITSYRLDFSDINRKEPIHEQIKMKMIIDNLLFHQFQSDMNTNTYEALAKSMGIEFPLS